METKKINVSKTKAKTRTISRAERYREQDDIKNRTISNTEDDGDKREKTKAQKFDNIIDFVDEREYRPKQAWQSCTILGRT